MVDYVFEVQVRPRDDGWWVEASGGEWYREWGPNPDRRSALRRRHSLLTRWCLAARVRGGWVWCITSTRWGVTLPPHLALYPNVGVPLAESEPRDALEHHGGGTATIPQIQS